MPEAEATAPDRGAKPRSLWTNRDYMGWWTGNTISALGTSVSNIAYPLLVLYTTGSVAKAGAITAANMIGMLLTTLWGGALADRVSRKAIMIVGPLVQAVALGSVVLLVLTKDSPVLLLAATALVNGLAAGLTMGASVPAMRRIVPKEQQAMATGQEMGRDMAAELLGAPLGGLLFAVTRWFPFFADAISFFFASLGAALIRRPLGPDRFGREQKTSMLADIGAGFRVVRAQPFLRFVVVWGSLLNIVGQGFILLFIALVRYRGGGPTTVGVVSAVALIGGIIGAVAAPMIMKRIRARLVLYVALWAFVGSFALVSVVPRPWEIGAVLLVAMLGMVPLNVVFESYMVRLVPDVYSGRVSAVSRFGVMSLQWAGPLIAGVLADTLGPPSAALALMAMMLPLALALHFTRSLGVLDQPVDEVSELTLPEYQLARN